MPRLTITSGPLAGQQFGFDDTAVVGRGAYSDIRLDDSTVSRRHAEFRREPDGGWSLHDLGSANGTLCDGRIVKGECMLEGTAEIVFGEVAARYDRRDAVRPASGRARSYENVLAQFELLTTLTSLPARREDPVHLIGLALDAMLKTFAGCSRVCVFVARPGAATLALLVQRATDASMPQESSAALAQAALRNVDGLAGRDLLPPTVGGAAASALAIPLMFAGETLGALVAEADSVDVFAAEDRIFAKALAAVLASLLDNQRSQNPERRVAERDLLLARRVQQHFLPQNTLQVAGYRIAETYVPARAVGGDHYDFFRYADGRIGLIIADVSGKAVSAALVMARFGMAVRLLAGQAHNPLDLLVTLNILLLDELESGMFVTAQVLALDPESGTLDLANAGHPAPLRRRANGKVDELALDPAAPLGANARTTFQASQHVLGPGDLIVFYTDGLNEAENEAGLQFGIQPATAAISPHADAQSALDAINAALDAFAGTTPAIDDLTLVVLSRD